MPDTETRGRGDTGTLKKHTCGKKPMLVMVTEWPAQYRIECACGKTALGCYYAHEDRAFRHAAAKKSAVEEWKKEAA